MLAGAAVHVVCRTLTILLWWIGASAGHAAVYGLPEPPTPAPTPQVWALFSDDFLGMAVFDTDDLRTVNLGFGGRLEGWRLGFDYSVLTNRGLDGTVPSRSDEVTMSLGYALVDQERAGEGTRWLVTVGGGGRAFGDYQGEELQNSVHEAFGYPTLHLPYDPEEGLGLFAFTHARLTTDPAGEYQGHGPFGRWFAQVEAGALGSTVGEVQFYGAVNLVSAGRDSLTWMGTRYQWNGGYQPTATGRIVADKESGWWLVVGMARSPGVLVTASYNPAEDTVAGTLGLTFDRDLPLRVGPGYTVDTALKFFPHGGNLGLDVRWQPSWLANVSWSPRDTVVVVYDFGVVPDYGWQDNSVNFDQLVVGWSPGMRVTPVSSPFVWTVAGYLAGGVRLERIHVEGEAPRFPDEGISAAVVAQAELGTRLGYRFTDETEAWYNQMRLGVGIDGWAPWPPVDIVRGSDHAEHQQPGFSIHVTIGVTVEW
jgi:hypothetical protein